MKTYHLYIDPSHAWLKVKREEVEALGILSEISHHSYQNKNYLYLEEDCDMPLFLEHFSKDEISIVEHHTNHHSNIRFYARVNA